VLHTPHGRVETPFFAVVGTAGTVKGVTPAELQEMGADVLLANTYHLYLRPGPDVVRSLGGLHRFMNWSGPLITDSGGYQVFSLGFGREHGVGKQIGMFPGAAASIDDAHASDDDHADDEQRAEHDRQAAGPDQRRPARHRGQAARLVRVDDDGATFTSHIDGSRQRLTPEASIRIQEQLGADVILAFDEPTSPLHDEAYTAEAMERTHAWARRCLAARTRADQALFGIVQGGAYEVLRTASARTISSLPFDGVAIGGSLGKSKADMHAVIDWSVPHLPADWPRHLLGIGEPEDLFACVERGIDQFDCVLPTRLGRHGVVYTAEGKRSVTRPEMRDDAAPIEPGCGCYTCRTGFSRGYLHHLFAANELLAYTLASLHNLYFIQALMQRIRQAVREDRLAEARAEFLDRYELAYATPGNTPQSAGGQ
jgi:tRNA-guanine transglycosylase